MHIPVLVNDLNKLISKGDQAIDMTFGRGGMTKFLLDAYNHVYAIDRDPEAISYGRKNFQQYKNIDFINCCFSDLLFELEKKISPSQNSYQNIDFQNFIANHRINSKDAENDICLPKNLQGKFDLIIADIGVSSPQIDDVERGFSFQNKAKLDMRMGVKSNFFKEQFSAFDLVNYLPQNRLVDIFKFYGQEEQARKITAEIIKQRKEKEIFHTTELAELIKRCKKYSKINPATKAFQALRIAVNHEIWELEQLLFQAAFLLKEDGRLIVISFHSIEDKIVKNFFKLKEDNPSRHDPSSFFHSDKENTNFWKDSMFVKTSMDEKNDNPRARSAKLRMAIRNEMPFFEILRNYYQENKKNYVFFYNWLTNLTHNEYLELVKKSI